MADESWRDESWREKTKDFLYPYLKSYQSLSPTTQELSEAEKEAQAQQTLRSIFGSVDPELSIGESIGFLDFTPAGFGFAVDESIREAGEAERKLDYIGPAIGLGLSAVEAYPVTKVMSKPVIGFLKNLFSKSTSAPVDKAKRETIAGMAAVPVAGALSNIPVNKIAPVAKKLIPKGFNLTGLASFKKVYDDYVDTVFRENSDMYDVEEMKEIILGEFDVGELKEMGINPNNITREDYLDDRIAERLAPNDPQAADMESTVIYEMLDAEDFEGSLIEKMINEIKEKYPDATDQEIFNEFGNFFMNAEEEFSDLIPKDKLKYNIDDYHQSQLDDFKKGIGED